MPDKISNKVYTVEEIKDLTNNIFRGYPVVKATLFGSYAKGCASVNSDIDIFIDTDGKLLGLDFIGLMVDIQEILEKDVELIDIKQVVINSRVDLEVKEYGVPLYEK